MAEDWAADVRKYVPDADDKVIAGIVKYCGIALRKRDSSLVSMTDPAETARVRDNFLKKKLGLTHSDEELDAGIEAVGQRMKGENFKNRVTVYYLLLDHFGRFDLFGGTAAAVAGAAGAASPSDTTPAQSLAGSHGSSGASQASSGLGWLWWLLLGLLALLLLWWLFFRDAGNAGAAASAEAAAPAASEAAVPADTTPA